MSRLFGDLPPESANKPLQESAGDAAPPNKRLKIEAEEAPVRKPQAATADPVAAALIKITAHISSSKKFTRASELLRQLLADDKVGQEHSKLLFEVMKQCYSDSTSLPCL